jgi:hypothetical protein
MRDAIKAGRAAAPDEGCTQRGHRASSEAIRGHQRTVARLDELELCVGILQRDATRRAQLLHLMKGAIKGDEGRNLIGNRSSSVLHLMRGAIKGDEGRNLVGNRSSSVAAAPPCARRPCIASEALGGLPLPHLMRRAIKGSSKAHPSASFAYKAIQSVAIRGNHDTISGNQWQSVAIRGNQR